LSPSGTIPTAKRYTILVAFALAAIAWQNPPCRQELCVPRTSHVPSTTWQSPFYC